ncbi:DNA helicase [Malassezia vespertilionis]|uniref:Transcription initiation factor IIF subunit beta n=1 Tax=Malassezia vespertilionis TaxID=2020962 RepID=A0A2N1JAU4_9BASI|nr:DNA helicase [Malassezia vespertilionis]PKI83675.1 hypothetical protein MVES_002581 [Malassezia vespertilionis]WFD07370.1 DNA helicase [Malassezia vespertilionis]
MSQYEDDVEAIAEPLSETNTSSLRQNADREFSPEPDQDLNTSRGTHQVWLVKVPKFLIDGWRQVKQDDVRLGTVRVYDPDASGTQRMELLLPGQPDAAIPVTNPLLRAQYANVPRAYDMRLTSSTQDTYLKNLYAFQEELVDDEDTVDLDEDESLDSLAMAKRRTTEPVPKGKKKRITQLAGTVTNETALLPKRVMGAQASDSKSRVGITNRSMLTDEYRSIMRDRSLQSTRPKRTVKMMDEHESGANNMLAAGVGKGHIKSRAANLVYESQARSKQGTEKFARMPRNELLDLLFVLFDRYKHWSLKRLREETQQPYTYLREVLQSIADQHHNGPYAGSWSLKREYGVRSAPTRPDAGPSQPKQEGV